MVFRKSFAGKASALALMFAVVLFLPGCPLSPGDDKTDPGNTVAPERDTVEGAVALFEWVWQNKNYDEYEQLLHTEFAYYPQNTDLEDFPWMQGDSWSRAEELGIARNMFDPAFVSEVTQETIDSIDMDVTRLSQRNLIEPPGAVEVTCNMAVTVLWAAQDGARSDVLLVFTLVPDPSNPSLWQIWRQDELPQTG